MGENERIHGDEGYVPEQERARAEEVGEAGGAPAMGDEADESERALAAAGQEEAEDLVLIDDDLVDEYDEVDSEKTEDV